MPGFENAACPVGFLPVGRAFSKVVHALLDLREVRSVRVPLFVKTQDFGSPSVYLGMNHNRRLQGHGVHPATDVPDPLQYSVFRCELSEMGVTKTEGKIMVDIEFLRGSDYDCQLRTGRWQRRRLY